MGGGGRKVDAAKESVQAWNQKDDLSRALLVGMHGAPELKKDEKAYHLGEFKERIIKMLTMEQAAEPVIYPEIEQALQEKAAAKMLISGAVKNDYADKYRRLAEKYKKPCTVIHDPKLKGEAGLAIVSEEAADSETIYVESRESKLKRLGLSEKLIRAAGKKLCRKCYSELVQSAPAEAANYGRLSFFDMLTGEKCAAHDEE